MTLWRWKTQLPIFRDELEQRRCVVWNSAADRYRRMLLKAARVLEKQLSADYEDTAFRAAYAILQMSGRFNPVESIERQAEHPDEK